MTTTLKKRQAKVTRQSIVLTVS